MNFSPLISSDIFNWIILPLLILLARIFDVRLGTIHISFVSKELKYLASLIGFVEVIIWLLAIRVIIQNLKNISFENLSIHKIVYPSIDIG